MNAVQKAYELGQAVWFDYIRRGQLASGDFQKLIDQGISGVTSNPAIFFQAITGSNDYDDEILSQARTGKNARQIYDALALEDIRAAADMLKPVYDKSKALDGYVSLEVSPDLAYDTENTIKEARQLFADLARPNVMIKVPATPEGIPAIRTLTGEGINVNATLIFSLELYQQVAEAYIAGMEDLVKKGGDASRTASVASFFVSRIDTAVDAGLEGTSAKDLAGKTAVACARLAYSSFKDIFGTARFQALKTKGARVQRPLWASTGTKNKAYSDLLYIETLIGPDTVNTMPPATLDAFLDHGEVEVTLADDVSAEEQVMSGIAAAGVNINAETDKLLADGVKAFADSFDKLLAGIEEKKELLLKK